MKIEGESDPNEMVWVTQIPPQHGTSETLKQGWPDGRQPGVNVEKTVDDVVVVVVVVIVVVVVVGGGVPHGLGWRI